MPNKPVLAITAGEPAGIGPDICLQTCSHHNTARMLVFADPALLADRAALLGLSFEYRVVEPDNLPEFFEEGCFYIAGTSLTEPVHPGQLNPANAAYVLQTLEMAVDACQAGFCDAMVTGPVHKGVINDAGFPFTGHTEFIADRVKASPVMMLACPGLRVALATTHLPLKDVSSAITGDSLKTLIRIIDRDLKKRFGIAKPVIYVCGLNPHAGEGGHLGREEIEIIGPALESLRENDGIELVGPLSADTLFTPRYLDKADAVLAMYHDQGLPVLKHKGFGNAVNITLGLPLIRTSVDHGTALELAGTGQADTGSMLQAIQIAVEMSINSRS